MDRRLLEEMTPEELAEAMSARLDDMEEADFDMAELDAYLDVLDEKDPVASEFDPAESCRVFLERHGELFPEEKPIRGPVLLDRKRRPRGRRIASRAAALAAAMIVVSLAVAAAVGSGIFARWGRGEFWFPGEEQDHDMPYTAEHPPLKEGEYPTLQAALDANGVTLALAPTWTPEAGDGFGALKETAVVSQEAQHALFEADYRDGQGRGYTVSLSRNDFRNATGNAFSFGAKDCVQYVRAGESYYIAPRPDGTVWVTWAREDWSGEIEGDLDVETAMALCASIHAGRGYVPPSGHYEPLGNDLANLVEVSGLDPNLAPTWLPEGLVKSDIHTQYGGIDGEAYSVQATFDDAQRQHKLTFHVEWWEEPAQAPAPVYADDEGGAEEQYPHNGVDFTIRTQADGGKTLVHWRSGHVSGYLYGDITGAEAKQIVDSIPLWSDVKPEKDTSNFHPGNVERQEYDSLEKALESSGLDTALAPAWLPEGYRLDQCESSDMEAWTDVFASYTKDDSYLMFHATWQHGGGASSGTFMKDDDPVVQYEHNGVTYYIMTNGEFRNIVWKQGDLEGSIGGPITLDEAKQIVDSIPFQAQSGE